MTTKSVGWSTTPQKVGDILIKRLTIKSQGGKDKKLKPNRYIEFLLG